MSILITLIILIIVFGLIWWLVGILPIPQPFKNVVIAILAVIGIIYLLGVAFGFGGFQPVRWR